jgi:hypothetical protein
MRRNLAHERHSPYFCLNIVVFLGQVQAISVASTEGDNNMRKFSILVAAAIVAAAGSASADQLLTDNEIDLIRAGQEISANATAAADAAAEGAPGQNATVSTDTFTNASVTNVTAVANSRSSSTATLN